MPWADGGISYLHGRASSAPAKLIAPAAPAPDKVAWTVPIPASRSAIPVTRRAT